MQFLILIPTLLLMFSIKEPLEIVQFHKDYTFEDWYIVNDGVMGGVSRSNLSLNEEGNALFEGSVSLDYNGGFASCRMRIKDVDMTGARALSIRLMGDGQKYKMRLRMSNSFDGVAYSTTFETEKGKWMEVELPLESFTPQFRGYYVPSAPDLEASKIGQLGIMIADKQEGPFSLEIQSISALF